MLCITRKNIQFARRKMDFELKKKNQLFFMLQDFAVAHQCVFKLQWFNVLNQVLCQLKIIIFVLTTYYMC